MTVSIRAAVPGDYPSIESVENASEQLFIDLLDPESWGTAPTGSERAAEQGFLIVAEESKTSTVVGFIHVLETDGIAHMEQVSVLPQHGRRGYGGRLVQAAMVEARGRGYESMTLRTYADVPWNAPFYARVGFVETEPATGFHKRLVEIEETFNLARYGRRVQMTATLP